MQTDTVIVSTANRNIETPAYVTNAPVARCGPAAAIPEVLVSSPETKVAEIETDKRGGQPTQ
jgi:hypothetical protein